MKCRLIIWILVGAIAAIVLGGITAGCEQESDDDDDHDVDDDEDPGDDEDDDDDSQVPVYRVIQVTNPEAQLQMDAAALGLDLAGASLEEDHDGWWIYTTDEFILKRSLNSGFFDYLAENVPTPHYVFDEEPITENEIADMTRDLLGAVGIAEEEIADVSVGRDVTQANPTPANPDPVKYTVGFLAIAKRTLGDTVVRNAEARVSFNADGVPAKIGTNWRDIDPAPVRYETPIDEATLMEQAQEAADEYSDENGSCGMTTQYGYVELRREELENEFALQFIVSLPDCGGYDVYIPATE